MAYIPGIDVSNDQGDIDWQKVAGAGIRFAILKCGNGNDGIDSKFAQNLAGCRAAGIPCGLYHFVYPIGLPDDASHTNRDPEGQAQMHFEASQGLGSTAGDLPPFGDWEWPPPGEFAQYGCSPTQLQDYIQRYMTKYTSLVGTQMGVYTDQFCWHPAGGASLSSLASVPFWS